MFVPSPVRRRGDNGRGRRLDIPPGSGQLVAAPKIRKKRAISKPSGNHAAAGNLCYRGEPPGSGPCSASKRSFTIENVPAGTWEARLWHERAGNVENAAATGNGFAWKEKRLLVTVPPDGATAGTVTIAIEQLK